MKKIDLTFVIEDDSIASYLIKKSLDEHPSFNQVEIFSNGKLAIDHLVDILDSNSPAPDLILLDINMSIMDGWEFLKALSDSSYSSGIPIFILTSSINTRDIQGAEDHDYVNGFISKPLDEDKLNDLLRKI